MTTWRVASDLASVMVPIGIAGAVLAAICAVVAAVAIIRGSEGLSGGAVAVWIVGALMSVTASFANQWMPLIAACAALVAMLVIGGVVRLIVGATADGRDQRRRDREEARVATTRAVPPVTTAPAVSPVSANTATVSVVS